MQIMPLVGIGVPDLESAVAEFSALFGIDFRVFTAGVDYELTAQPAEGADTAPTLPSHVRIAVDNKDTFEILELPDSEGFRNIHARVDSMEEAISHCARHGLTPSQDLRAGIAREVIFDAAQFHGIRLCLLEFEGDSFSAALAASTPVPVEG